MICRSVSKTNWPGLRRIIISTNNQYHDYRVWSSVPTKSQPSALRPLSTFVDTNRSIFPWRHNSSLPERILERNDLSGSFNPTARDPKFLRKIIAARELNIPIWDALPIPLHRNDWEVTLANNFASAFTFAMEELFRSVFRGMIPVPMSIQFCVLNLIIYCTYS